METLQLHGASNQQVPVITTDTTRPDAVSHMLAAVTELWFAHRDLQKLGCSPAERAQRQDSLEFADEAADLVRLIINLLE